MQRRHDIDALRVLAFGFLILYHVAMLYVWDWDFHIKSSYQTEWLQWPMIFLNRWRMPLLFAISGIAIGLYQPERGPWRFAWLRSWRLLLPLLFGMFVVVPIQPWCQGLANGSFDMGFGAFLLRYWQVRPWPAGSFDGWASGITWNHLWYLAYLWIYTLALLALLPLLRTRAGQRVLGLLTGRRGWALMVLPAIPLLAYLFVLKPRFPETHALFGDWYLHAQYFTVFLYGYAIARADGLWQALADMRRKTLSVAMVSITVYLLLRAAGRYLPADRIPHAVPEWVWGVISHGSQTLYLWTALLAIFGWGHALLDRPFRWLPYTTEAVYPWYMLHQSLIIPIAFALIPLHLGPVLEPALVLFGTVGGCLLLHEFVIRRSGVLRPLFGLKRKPASTSITAFDIPAFQE
jgi:surface polysaccharide O-acyltransferase-like enzyme